MGATGDTLDRFLALLDGLDPGLSNNLKCLKTFRDVNLIGNVHLENLLERQTVCLLQQALHLCPLVTLAELS